MSPKKKLNDQKLYFNEIGFDFHMYQETGFNVTVNPLPKSILYVKDGPVRVKEREHKVWTRNFTHTSVITLTFDLETWLKITVNSLQKALCG